MELKWLELHLGLLLCIRQKNFVDVNVFPPKTIAVGIEMDEIFRLGLD